jgi:uncharacterized protein YbbK (DUF523 family)/uncharacterized protein YbgA (DUF1722 family)
MREPTGNAGLVSEEVVVGVSTCLLGQRVRHDGGHRRDPFVADMLAPYVRFVAVCPEVEIGLGVPREAIHLLREAGETRLVGVRSGRDHTAAMRAYARRRVAELAALDLSGYIFKANSPSCGLQRVPIDVDGGHGERRGRGLFAATLMEQLPLLPVEEESRLHDAKRRENFLERVFAYRRVQRLFAGPWTAADLVRFHHREQMLLLAHDRSRFLALGWLVARVATISRAEVAQGYTEGFMSALKKVAARSGHVIVLTKAAGFLRGALGASSLREITSVIDDYRDGKVPLSRPVALLRHHVRVQAIESLASQSYLESRPVKLALRDHV